MFRLVISGVPTSLVLADTGSLTLTAPIHDDPAGGVVIAAARGASLSVVGVADTLVHVASDKVDGSVVLVGEDVVIVGGRLLDDLPGHGVHHGGRALSVRAPVQAPAHSLYLGEDEGGPQDDEDGEKRHDCHGDDVDTAGHLLILHHLHRAQAEILQLHLNMREVAGLWAVLHLLRDCGHDALLLGAHNQGCRVADGPVLGLAVVQAGVGVLGGQEEQRSVWEDHSLRVSVYLEAVFVPAHWAEVDPTGEAGGGSLYHCHVSGRLQYLSPLGSSKQ